MYLKSLKKMYYNINQNPLARNFLVIFKAVQNGAAFLFFGT